MKQIILAFLISFFIPFISFCQQPPWNNPSNNKLDVSELKSPKISWVEDSYELGNIPQGKPVTVTYEFTNTGNAPLIISNVEPACDCTNAQWPKTPVMPGQKGKIQVTFDAKNGGNFSKTAIVTSNAKPNKSQIVFTGTVVKKK